MGTSAVGRPTLPVAAALCMGLAATGWGLIGFDPLAPYTWASPGRVPMAGFTGSFLLVASVCYLLGPRWRAGALSAALLLWVTAAAGVGPVMAALLLGISSLALGAMVLGTAGAERLGTLMSALLSVAIGLALYSGAINYASHVSVNRPVLYIGAFAATAVLARREVAFYGAALREWLVAPGQKFGALEYCAFSVLVYVLALQSVFSALPEQYHDALAVHLFVALKMAQVGWWETDPAHFVGSIAPQGANWLFSAGAILAGEAGAKVVNFGLALVLTGLVFVLTGADRPRAIRLLAAALFASMPLTFIVTASLFAENALALFCTSMTALLALSWTDLRRRDALAIGALMGAAALVKLQGVLFAVPFGLALVIRLVTARDVRSGIMTATLVAAVFFLIGLEPYLHAYVETGNPVFPLFNAIFRSPLFETSANFADNWSGKLTWDLPFRWTFESSRFIEGGNGVIGFALLAFLPAGIVSAVVQRDRTMLIAVTIAGGYVALLVSQTQYIRYAYYALPILTAACAGGLAALATGRRATAGVAILAVCFVAGALACIPTGGWILSSFDVGVLLAPDRQRPWLDARVPQRGLVDVINAHAGADAVVLLVGQPVAAGLRGKAHYLNWYNPALTRALATSRTPDDIGRVFRREGLTHVIASRSALEKYGGVAAYLLQTAQVVAEKGGATLYQLNYPLEQGDELLGNTEFLEGFKGWAVLGNVSVAAGDGPLIGPSSQLAQAIPVAAGDVVVVSARTLCSMRRSDLQLQINWLDERSAMVRTNIKPYVCDRPGTQVASERYVAPPGSQAAFIYLKAVGGEPVFVQSVSARKQ